MAARYIAVSGYGMVRWMDMMNGEYYVREGLVYDMIWFHGTWGLGDRDWGDFFSHG